MGGIPNNTAGKAIDGGDTKQHSREGHRWGGGGGGGGGQRGVADGTKGADSE